MDFMTALQSRIKLMPLHKTRLYKYVSGHKIFNEENKAFLKEMNVLDFIGIEIICRSYDNLDAIDEFYDAFLFEHSDAIDYMSYQDHQIHFTRDLLPRLSQLPHFHDERSDLDIYVPIYDSAFNQQLLYEYQRTKLKQSTLHLSDIILTPETPVSLYGIGIYDTAFSSLEKILETDLHVDYYFNDLKMILMFHKKSGQLFNYVPLYEESMRTRLPQRSDAQYVVSLIEGEDYFKALRYLTTSHFITRLKANRIAKALQKGDAL